MKESKHYFFYTVGCGWCTRVLPIIDKLNEEGHNIWKLDLAEPENKEVQIELKSKYNIKCGTPLFIDTKTGKHVCGYREKDILLKWLNGEDVPPPPIPKSPMPRPPFFGSSKREEQKWTKEYEKWADDNSHLSNLKTAKELLLIPRPKSAPPQVPYPSATESEVNKWKRKYTLWVRENNHLKNLSSADRIINQLRQTRSSQDTSLIKRVEQIEQKLDKLMAHLGIK